MGPAGLERSAQLLASLSTSAVRRLGTDALAALKQNLERDGIGIHRLTLRRLLDQPPAAAIAPPARMDDDLWSWAMRPNCGCC